jgi:hypothetical protein
LSVFDVNRTIAQNLPSLNRDHDMIVNQYLRESGENDDFGSRLFHFLSFSFSSLLYIDIIKTILENTILYKCFFVSREFDKTLPALAQELLGRYRCA